MSDVWTLIEDAPETCEAVADLYRWSTNYGAGKGPMTLYLDLIGWSEDNFGEPLYDTSNPMLGYLELDKLGRALMEYANRPSDISRFVDSLMEAERSCAWGDVDDRAREYQSLASRKAPA